MQDFLMTGCSCFWLERCPNDACTLQQIAEETLDCISTYQYVQNEVLQPLLPLERIDNLVLQHSPMLVNTMSGTIYLKNKPIQIYHQIRDGFIFKDYSPSKVKVTSARLNLFTGEISFIWNEKPGDHNYVVSYEYNIEWQYNDDQ